MNRPIKAHMPILDWFLAGLISIAILYVVLLGIVMSPLAEFLAYPILAGLLLLGLASVIFAVMPVPAVSEEEDND